MVRLRRGRRRLAGLTLPTNHFGREGRGLASRADNAREREHDAHTGTTPTRRRPRGRQAEDSRRHSRRRSERSGAADPCERAGLEAVFRFGALRTAGAGEAVAGRRRANQVSSTLTMGCGTEPPRSPGRKSGRALEVLVEAWQTAGPGRATRSAREVLENRRGAGPAGGRHPSRFADGLPLTRRSFAANCPCAGRRAGLRLHPSGVGRSARNAGPELGANRDAAPRAQGSGQGYAP